MADRSLWNCGWLAGKTTLYNSCYSRFADSPKDYTVLLIKEC
ncbi:hypothetical protein ASZ90_005444 [hydrocarbon metagenome]|uniref:Uncharacterized protein n=1 Tax=hydrocarbon metagenome TaxID=938273 RepID=A0A0W8FV78_9ZZZZ